MATIRKIVPAVANYELTLTLDEAQFLRRLLGSHVIGGGALRSVADSIWGALTVVPDYLSGEEEWTGTVDLGRKNDVW